LTAYNPIILHIEASDPVAIGNFAGLAMAEGKMTFYKDAIARVVK
jgi:hypothetical protein